MAYARNVGEVSTDGETTIRWTIPRYLHMQRQEGTQLVTPLFTFRGKKGCCLEVYILYHGDTEKCFGIDCRNLSLPPFISVIGSMVNTEGQEMHTMTMRSEVSYRYQQYYWMRQRELEAQRNELLPEGQLRLVFRVVLPGGRGQEEKETESGAQVAASTLDASSSITSHSHSSEGAEADLAIFDASNNSTSSSQCNEGERNFIQNLKELYVQSVDCDFTIRVKDREFRAHRLLLKARVPTFSAMLTHDMSENKEGVVDIQDCDPDVFNEFLLFIYSGRVENLTPDNMCGLYLLGDKYGLPDIKKACLDFMKTSLTVETVCDVISLASTHDEAGLLKLATDFFVNKSEEILTTVKWQVFMEENPTKGNELFLKTVKFFKTKLQRSTN